jgi:coenzyme F420-dependent glucose-6-phosphate dehydrogenase
MRYWVQLATEQFPPSALVRQAVEAERADFDALNVSDHLQPWWEDMTAHPAKPGACPQRGESGHAWALLGAIGQATAKLGVGTGVTAPVYRHNPVVVAQFAATIEELCPGRAYLGIGSGEALNEAPCGMDWPPVSEQVERMDEALEIINRLLDGERLNHDGRFYRTKAAYLHTRGERRPPVYVSAFGPRAAAVAARRSDGVWTLADPEQAPEIIDAYRGACDDAGKEPGEIILQAGFSWAEDDDAALEGSRVWKSTQIPDYFTDDWHDPRAMYERAEREVSDDDFKEAYIVSSDPEVHAERVREIERLGATVVCLQNGSGSAPERALRVYGDQVLPALRGARV